MAAAALEDEGEVEEDAAAAAALASTVAEPGMEEAAHGVEVAEKPGPENKILAVRDILVFNISAGAFVSAFSVGLGNNTDSSRLNRWLGDLAGGASPRPLAPRADTRTGASTAASARDEAVDSAWSKASERAEAADTVGTGATGSGGA
ncbi:hypothetical protein ACP70R_000134 [Stipagrostis hirtigluma subsp. patula]